MKSTQTPVIGHCVGLVTAALLFAVAVPAYATLPSFQTPDVTRAEGIMILLQARVPSIPALTSNGEFSDVAKGSWYERYIVIADRLGILQANPVTHKMRPDDPVTRAEFVSMAAKTFGITTDTFIPSYADVPRESWYAGAAALAQRLFIFPSDPDPTRMKPDDFMTHDEVARAVQIFSDKTVVKKQTGAQSSTAPWYQTISTNTQQIAIVKPRGPVMHAASSSAPLLYSYIKSVPASSDVSQTSKLRTEVLKLVNAARLAAGLRPLVVNTTLESSAQQYAKDMAEQDFFGHISPTGASLKDRMEKSGYYKPFFQSDCLCVAHYVMGENLARGQKTAKEVVNDWMNSPSHREAILSADFTDTGIGIDAGVWVEHFGGKQN